MKIYENGKVAVSSLFSFALQLREPLACRDRLVAPGASVTPLLYTAPALPVTCKANEAKSSSLPAEEGNRQ